MCTQKMNTTMKRYNDEKHSVNRWILYHNGWTSDMFDQKAYVRDDEAFGVLKQASGKGSLDGDTPEWMTTDQTMFSYQFLNSILYARKIGSDR